MHHLIQSFIRKINIVISKENIISLEKFSTPIYCFAGGGHFFSASPHFS